MYFIGGSVVTKDKAFYFKLFQSTFYLSAFTFGGGYVIVPLMKKKFVDELGWLDEKEMLDFVAIAQSAPGVIAVNTSILIGYRLAGIFGAFLTILGTILPPLIIISMISLFYQSFRDHSVLQTLMLGMQAGVAAVIADVVFTMINTMIKQKQLFALVLFVLSFIGTFILKLHILFIFFFAAACGVVHLISSRHAQKKET